MQFAPIKLMLAIFLAGTLIFTPSLFSYANTTLEVGIDEYLPAPGPKFEPTGFEEFFNLNDQQVEDFRKKALAFYEKRFGIDCSGCTYDKATGITTGTDFVILPVTFGGSYAVLNSNSEQIPVEVNGIRTLVQIAEFVLVFNEHAAGKYYGGSYSPDGVKPVDPTHTISFGMYRLVLGDGRNFDISMQSKVPNRIVSKETGQVLVRLWLHSKEFGEGSGVFKAIMQFTPNTEGLYKTFVKGYWNFSSSAKSHAD